MGFANRNRDGGYQTNTRHKNFGCLSTVLRAQKKKEIQSGLGKKNNIAAAAEESAELSAEVNKREEE